MAVWQIRAGSKAESADEFIDKGLVRIGFGLTRSLTEFPTLDALREWMETDAPRQGPRAADSLWMLMHEVEIGDLVVLPSKPGGREYAIGRITGHYQHAPDPGNPDSDAGGLDMHTRTVQWLMTGIPGERLSHIGLPPRATIARLRGGEAAARIEAILD